MDIPVNKETLHIIIPEQRYNDCHHHFRDDEEVTEILAECITYPRNFR